MHLCSSAIRELLENLKQCFSDERKIEIAICPAFPYLVQVFEHLSGSGIRLGAQNMHEEDEGAFTGEVSSLMLRDVGCDYVIIGHSERRRYFGETDLRVRDKTRKALDAGLKPIVCVGETLNEREAGQAQEVVGSQVSFCLKGLDAYQACQLTFAYEPVWAIGTGKNATPEQAQTMHRFIRDLVVAHFDGDTGQVVRILYGGSVKPQNASDLMRQADIDGALVGGASLKADSFFAIIQAAITC